MAPLVSACLLVLITILNSVNSIVVNSTVGPIEGESDGYVTTFYGIPFAHPPIGELRFAAPQEITEPIGTVDSPYDATVDPITVPACPQQWDTVQSEDCLYLNIYAPADAAMGVTNYTVMIWIYGGSFILGYGTAFIYDATNWVDNIGDIIIVTINYRLGVLGFLYDNTYETGVEGNYGLQDQQMAIKWVYDNIAYFGGNPDNINIFGESAGASSVGLHLLYNQEYIKSGIMQSNFPLFALRTPETWYDAPYQFNRLVNCSDYEDDSTMLLNCWRNVSVDVIMTAQASDQMSNNWLNTVFSPTVETEWLLDQPMWAIGRDPTPPFMTGTTNGEFYSFIDTTLPAVYDVAYASLAAIVGTSITDTVFEFYNETSTNSITGNYLYDFATMVTDWWRCSIRYQLEQLGDDTDNIYYYNFDVVNRVMNELVFRPGAVECYDIACHFDDVFYLFMVDFYENAAIAAGQNATVFIGEEMQILWSNFAKTLNANDAGDGEDLMDVWPEYTNEEGVDNFLDIIDYGNFSKKSTDNDIAEICALWNSVGYAGKFTDPNATPEPTTQPTEVPSQSPIKGADSIEIAGAFISQPFISSILMAILLSLYLI